MEDSGKAHSVRLGAFGKGAAEVNGNSITRRTVIAALAAAPRARAQEEFPDLSSVQPDLEIPALSSGDPGPGKRVRRTNSEYAGTDVHHTIYLPVDWIAGKPYPVIVEYAGNGNFKNAYGDISTGEVEGSKLGHGISRGTGFIWICLPYVNSRQGKNEIIWWGDVDATVAYARNTVRRVCEEYGGDPKSVILSGFSRGAIACNYIGLHDDAIARLWRAFIAYSHYDGVITTWPYEGADRASAARRLARLNGRPVFVCQERSIEKTRTYIESSSVKASFTYQRIGFRNHNDGWGSPRYSRTACRPGKLAGSVECWPKSETSNLKSKRSSGPKDSWRTPAWASSNTGISGSASFQMRQQFFVRRDRFPV